MTEISGSEECTLDYPISLISLNWILTSSTLHGNETSKRNRWNKRHKYGMEMEMHSRANAFPFLLWELKPFQPRNKIHGIEMAMTNENWVHNKICPLQAIELWDMTAKNLLRFSGKLSWICYKFPCRDLRVLITAQLRHCRRSFPLQLRPFFQSMAQISLPRAPLLWWVSSVIGEQLSSWADSWLLVGKF